jgi:hypothetical protein
MDPSDFKIKIIGSRQLSRVLSKFYDRMDKSNVYKYRHSNILHECMTAEIRDSIHLCRILVRWSYDGIRPATLRPCRRMGTVNHC